MQTNKLSCAALVMGMGIAFSQQSRAVEIPLDAISPVRIGYVDLQKVFDTYPEKSFAEGDLLREIEKRKRDLGRRQNEINTLREQVKADDEALSKARTGAAVIVPTDNVPSAAPAPVKTPEVKASTNTPVQPYPTEDPLAGLPGHPGALPTPNANALPGLKSAADKPPMSLLDQLASATTPSVLSAEAMAALESRLEKNRQALARAVTSFKTFRTNAVGDMKQLQTEKTYGVMAKVYATLQNLARDENITVVLDKAYVLYGEDTVDLSDKLITRLQAESQ